MFGGSRTFLETERSSEREAVQPDVRKRHDEVASDPLDAGMPSASAPDSGIGWRRIVAPVLAIAAVLALPFFYASINFDRIDLWNAAGWQAGVRLHILLNTVCNGLVFLIALRTKQRHNLNVGYALAVTVLVHGLLMLLMLSARLYFSRSLLIEALLISAMGASLLLILHRPVMTRRVAVIPLGLTGDLHEWVKLSRAHIVKPETDLTKYDLIVMDCTQSLSGKWNQQIARAMLRGSQIAHLPEFAERTAKRVALDHFDIEQLSNKRSNHRYQLIKPFIDKVVVILALPVVALILVPAMLAIRVTMGRPVLFIQKRVGLGGEVFRLYKLRTMRLQAPSEPSRATAKNDDRITPLGKFLRRYRIDELPQLYNVLRGEMSLIGPRPEQPDLVEKYENDVPGFSYRHLVRPGISGWAQVRGGYASNAEESRAKLTYDLYYVKYLSPALDFAIAIWTIRALLTGNSAR